MMKAVKIIFVSSFVLLLFIFWHNTNNKQVNISSSQVALISQGAVHFHSGVHNCAWDGDDVLTERSEVDLVPGYITAGLLSFHLETPSMAAYSIWQPPKIS